MGDTVVIELGVPGPPSEQRTDAPPSTRSRRLPARLAALALVTALGGAAPAAPPPTPVIIPAAATDTMVRVGDRVYVYSPTVGTSGVGELRGYQLPQARLVSRFPMTVPGPLINVEVVGSTLLVSSRSEFDGNPHTTAVDASTGAVRWKQAAVLLGLSPSSRSALTIDDVPGEQRWQGVDLTTGRPGWTFVAGPRDITLPAGVGHSVDRLVTLRPSGRVEVRDTETGTVTAAATLPAPQSDPQSGPAVWTSNDLLLVGTESGLDGYGLDRLDLRWQNTTMRSANGFVHPSCGDVICFDSATGGWAIDPGTGRVRWSNGRWSAYLRIGRYLLGGPVDQPADDAPQVVFDAVTGEPRGTFGRWQPAGDPRPDGKIIGLRREPGAQVWFALLDPGPLSVRVIAVAYGASGRCEVGVTALLCQRADGSIGVWRLPALDAGGGPASRP